MIRAADTDVLVNWAMTGAVHHRVTRRFLDREIREGGRELGVTPLVLHEFLQVSTDARRFENPLSMDEGLRSCLARWNSSGASCCGVKRIATWIVRDFEVFTFLEVVTPS